MKAPFFNSHCKLILLVSFYLATTLIFAQSPGYNISREIGLISTPNGVAVDSQGKVYAVDAFRNKIKVYAPTGELLLTFGKKGRGIGELNYPSRIALDQQANIYVLDNENHRVQVFDNNGNFLRSVGGRGNTNGLFERPGDIAIDQEGLLYVSDTYNHRIQVFDGSGAFVRKFGIEGTADGQLYYPYRLTVDHNDFIYVIDNFRTGNSLRLQVFTNDGTFARKMTAPLYAGGMVVTPNNDLYISDDLTVSGTPSVFIRNNLNGAVINSFPVVNWSGSLGNVSGIALDNNGKVYVACPRYDRIEVFNQDGTPFTKIGQAFGTKDGQVDYPTMMVIDKNKNLYVADNTRIQVFDSTGNFLRKFGSYGTGAEQFSIPNGMAIDEDGKLYLSDSFKNQIMIFNNDGTFNSKFTSTAPGGITPRGIAIGKDRKIYVADRLNDRVQVFDNVGNLIFTFGSNGSGDGQFKLLSALALDTEDNIYTSEVQENNRVQVFDKNGNFLRKFNQVETSDEQMVSPSAITVDQQGKIYVCEQNRHRLVIFNNDGSFYEKYGSYGNFSGTFHSPASVVTSEDGTIFVADQANDRVQVISPLKIAPIENFGDTTIRWSPAGYTFTATSEHRNDVQYEIIQNPGTTASVSILGNKMTINTVGFVKILASASDGEFQRATKEATITINKADQEIFFNDIPDMMNTADPTEIKLQAWSSSGLPITFSLIEGSDIVTLLDSTITVNLKKGNVTVKAEQQGNGFYNAAPEVTKTFTIFQDPVLNVDEGLDSRISLFPNPAHDKLLVSHPVRNIERLTIQSLHGAKVFDKRIDTNTYELNLSSFNRGLYLVITEDNQGKLEFNQIIIW